jgi:hypothetical protein
MVTPMLARTYKEFLKLLNSNHVEYLLIGGYPLESMAISEPLTISIFGSTLRRKCRQD